MQKVHFIFEKMVLSWAQVTGDASQTETLPATVIQNSRIEYRLLRIPGPGVRARKKFQIFNMGGIYYETERQL